MTATLSFGYTPDPDDAFHHWALETGRVGVAGHDRLTFVHEHVQTLNERALREQLDVTAISSAFYPTISDRYVVLSTGASVGRGYGPALAARRPLESLEGLRVAIPGVHTTGAFLLRYFYDGFDEVEMPFDRIAPAVATGRVDAGVLIHEELLRYRSHDLVRVACLGERWCRETGLPLPVGLIVARRALGSETLRRVRDGLRGSLEEALAHPEEAFAFARRFGTEEDVDRDFVTKFANDDTLSMPDDVRRGLWELYRRAHLRGLIDREPRHEIV